MWVPRKSKIVKLSSWGLRGLGRPSSRAIKLASCPVLIWERVSLFFGLVLVWEGAPWPFSKLGGGQW